jgi:hypothetical protein
VTSNAGSAASRRLNAFAFYDLRDALPVFAALAVLFVADATVDDVTTLGLIVLVDVAGVFAALAYLGAGDRGERRRCGRERFSAALDDTERKARRAAVRLPLVAAIVIAVIAGGGVPDAGVAAAALAAGYLLSQVIFALWLNARHSRRKRPA